MAAKRASTKTSATKDLARYRAKRSFDITAEPSGGAPTKGGNSFVVQKHAATRLHYDFRLEQDGVLLSWAVPKGPSLDPADKRLAAHVEDHPTDYGGFEGTIPQGQYGGGTVMLWDRGTWEPQPGEDPQEGYRKGRLKFILHGERMKGGWTLVRMGPRGQERNSDNWLLIKERDAEARPGEGTLLVDKGLKSIASGRTMEQIGAAPDRAVWQSNRNDDDEAPKAKKASAEKPPSKKAATKKSAGKKTDVVDFVPPTLATLVDRPPTGDKWVHEIKIDGYRIYARRRDGKVALLTRTGLDWTGRFPTIAQAVAKLPGDDLALDGEVAVLDQNGGSSFAALQDSLSRGDPAAQRYVVFDLLYRDGDDLRGMTLLERKESLRNLLSKAKGPLVYSDHVASRGDAVYQHACNLALEGVVSKRGDLPYHEGRTRDWLKSKCVSRQEFVIAGFTDSTAHRGIGSLALAYYEDETLHYAGRVGTGFDQRSAADLYKRLKPLETDHMPFDELPSTARRGVHFVSPELVCEVAFLNWTPDGVLRHPSFQGLREDKPAKSVTRDRALRAGAAAKESGKDETMPETSTKTAARKAGTSDNKVAGVTITHPDRVIFPESGITKRQLAEYYASVADWIVPQIASRPLSLLRCPASIGDKCFFQKHFATGLKTLKRVKIEEKHGAGEYVVLRDVQDLVLLAQEGIVEIHPWGATADDPDSPDQFIFDFDPAPDLPFTAVVDAAKTMRDYLAEMKIESFVKTTGGKGLHVVAPIRRGISWAELKAFTKKVADNFATAAPKRFTTNMAKRERTDRIFIDYLRNDRGSTAVAPYSVRARPGAPVALPLDWSALKPGLDPHQFTITTVPKLLAARKADPWAGMSVHRQTIAGAQRALGIAA